MDYRPSPFMQNLASARSLSIGVLTQTISSPIYDSILRGILLGLEGSGYSPIFADGYWDAAREEKALMNFLNRNVDGLIILGGQVPEDILVQISQRLPLLIIGRKILSLEKKCLILDNFWGAYNATQYLIDMGHTRIAHITGLYHHPDSQERLKGYVQALQDAKISVNEDLIVEGDFSEPSGLMGVEVLLRKKQTFSALFAANDQMAYGARLAFFRNKIRVPDNLSLVGFDDQSPSAYTIPPLTTVRQPAFEIGETAAKAILNFINDEPYHLPTLPANLIIRESVALNK
jgi:LacI family transcriptional regulator